MKKNILQLIPKRTQDHKRLLNTYTLKNWTNYKK